MNNQQLLQHAAQHYKVNIENAKLLKGYSNQIYECEDKILQFTSKAYKQLIEIQMELSWINYLRGKGVSVVEVIPSNNGKLFEETETHLIVCYKKIEGSKVDKTIWNEQHIFRLGKLTGQLHKFGKTFAEASNFNFKHWHEIPKSKINPDLPKDERELSQLHEKLLQEFHQYSINRDNYGLIHYDIHHGNYLREEDGKIVLFDFEMMSQSWYVHEVGTVLYYALLLPNMKDGKEKSSWFLTHFMEGYLQENQLAKEELDKIPKYLLYRDLLVYAYVCKIWTEEEITTANRAFREKVANSIANRRKGLGL